jgi:hypothetical protein
MADRFSIKIEAKTMLLVLRRPDDCLCPCVTVFIRPDRQMPERIENMLIHPTI